MLDYTLIGAHAGIHLRGHADDFAALAKATHDIVARTPLIRCKDDTAALALAYALRKAYDKDPGRADAGAMLSTAEITWPELLITSRVLRESLAYIDHGKPHQAALYALEAVIEAAVREDFGPDADDVLCAWARIDGDDEALLDGMDDIVETYGGVPATHRATRLDTLLAPSWLHATAP